MKFIPLTRGKYAIVDDEDYGELNKHKWCALKKHDGRFYAVRWTSRSVPPRMMIKMHRHILGILGIFDRSVLVDHRDGDGLNNQRDNLRQANSFQNAHNRKKRTGVSSRYKGVTWCKRDSNWRAFIGYGGKSISLGVFQDEAEAGEAYRRKAIELYGDFAYAPEPDG